MDIEKWKKEIYSFAISTCISTHFAFVINAEINGPITHIFQYIPFDEVYLSHQLVCKSFRKAIIKMLELKLLLPTEEDLTKLFGNIDFSKNVKSFVLELLLHFKILLPHSIVIVKCLKRQKRRKKYKKIRSIKKSLSYFKSEITQSKMEVTSLVIRNRYTGALKKLTQLFQIPLSKIFPENIHFHDSHISYILLDNFLNINKSKKYSHQKIFMELESHKRTSNEVTSIIQMTSFLLLKMEGFVITKKLLHFILTFKNGSSGRLIESLLQKKNYGKIRIFLNFIRIKNKSDSEIIKTLEKFNNIYAFSITELCKLKDEFKSFIYDCFTHISPVITKWCFQRSKCNEKLAEKYSFSIIQKCWNRDESQGFLINYIVSTNEDESVLTYINPPFFHLASSITFKEKTSKILSLLQKFSEKKKKIPKVLHFPFHNSVNQEYCICIAQKIPFSSSKIFLRLLQKKFFKAAKSIEKVTFKESSDNDKVIMIIGAIQSRLVDAVSRMLDGIDVGKLYYGHGYRILKNIVVYDCGINVFFEKVLKKIKIITVHFFTQIINEKQWKSHPDLIIKVLLRTQRNIANLQYETYAFSMFFDHHISVLKVLIKRPWWDKTDIFGMLLEDRSKTVKKLKLLGFQKFNMSCTKCKKSVNILKENYKVNIVVHYVDDDSECDEDDDDSFDGAVHTLLCKKCK